MALYTCVDNGNKSATGFFQPLRPPQPQNSLWDHIWPQIWNQWPQLPTYSYAYCLYGLGPFGSLWGHHSLQTASEITYGLRFEIRDSNYLLIPRILLIWHGPFWQSPRPSQPPNSLGGQISPQIWNQRPQLPTYPCAYCLYGMGPFLQHLRPLQPPNSLRDHIWP